MWIVVCGMMVVCGTVGGTVIMLIVLCERGPLKCRLSSVGCGRDSLLLITVRDQCIEAEAHDRVDLGLPGQQLELLKALWKVCFHCFVLFPLVIPKDRDSLEI